jgi:hypothetical protein
MPCAQTTTKAEMRIEAFSEGKNLDEPEANEDQFVVLPRPRVRGDRRRHRYLGRIVDGHAHRTLAASRIVQQAVAQIACDPLVAAASAPREIVERITRALHAAYSLTVSSDEVRDRSAAPLRGDPALALDLGHTFRFILVGDSGLRLNGKRELSSTQRASIA